MEHLVHGDQIGRRGVERQGPDIGMAHGTMAQARLFQVQPRHVEHGMVDVDANPAINPVGEDLQHTPRPDTDIDHQAERTVTGQFAHRRFDFMIGQVEGPDTVPVLGDAFEIGLGGIGPGLFDGFQTREIPRHHRIFLGQEIIRHLRQTAAAARFAQPVEDIGPFRQALGEAGFGQEFEVARDPRLTLPQDLDQFGDRQLAARQQGGDAQAGRFGERLELSYEGIHDIQIG